MLPLGSIEIPHAGRKTQYVCEEFTREENLAISSLQYNLRRSRFPDIVPVFQNGVTRALTCIEICMRDCGSKK